jgi:hypothetical protein
MRVRHRSCPVDRTPLTALIAVFAAGITGVLPARADDNAAYHGRHYTFTYVLASTAVAAYQATAVPDGGTIKGTVLFTGPVPVKTVIPKDAPVCGPPFDEAQVIVGANKGVAHAVVFLDGVTKGRPMTRPAKAPELDNKNCKFVPETQVIPPGPIVVINSDPVLHNTKTFYGRRTAFNLALPNQGQRITSELPRPGIVRVECDAHGHMHGTIYVADNPYHDVTGTDGAFTITGVPPGQYKLVAYQRYAGPVETTVTVKPRETVNVSIDLKK